MFYRPQRCFICVITNRDSICSRYPNAEQQRPHDPKRNRKNGSIYESYLNKDKHANFQDDNDRASGLPRSTIPIIRDAMQGQNDPRQPVGHKIVPRNVDQSVDEISEPIIDRVKRKREEYKEGDHRREELDHCLDHLDHAKKKAKTSLKEHKYATDTMTEKLGIDLQARAAQLRGFKQAWQTKQPEWDSSNKESRWQKRE